MKLCQTASPHKTRQRALIVSRNATQRKELAVLLSAYGYCIDEESTRKESLARFLSYKHSVVIVDKEFLPRIPDRLQRLYTYAHRVPLVFITTPADEMQQVYPYLKKSAYGVINLPLNPAQASVSFERAVEYAEAKSANMFMKDFFYFLSLSLPLAALFVFTVVLK